MSLPVPENPKLSAVNPHFKNKYSPLDEVLRVLKPIFEKGWVVQQTVEENTETSFLDDAAATTRKFVTSVFSPEGELINTVEFPFFIGREDPQGLGSALTYARRYGLCLAFNIAGETDDDAEAAQGRSTTPTTAPRRRSTTRTK
jgi:hypothetical protein